MRLHYSASTVTCHHGTSECQHLHDTYRYLTLTVQNQTHSICCQMHFQASEPGKKLFPGDESFMMFPGIATMHNAFRSFANCMMIPGL